MRCPACGALYLFHLDEVFTCTEGHSWHWGDDGLAVRVPPSPSWIWITGNPPEAEDISTWEGEGGRWDD